MSASQGLPAATRSRKRPGRSAVLPTYTLISGSGLQAEREDFPMSLVWALWSRQLQKQRPAPGSWCRVTDGLRVALRVSPAIFPSQVLSVPETATWLRPVPDGERRLDVRLSRPLRVPCDLTSESLVIFKSAVSVVRRERKPGLWVKSRVGGRK